MLLQLKQASTRVMLNTGVLYVKMLITMGISLYSTRLVLNALGASDYGIFNLIAGVIAMLAFLNTAMTVSTQRYLSFHQGSNDFSMQKKIFIHSWILHIIIGSIVVAFLLIMVPFLFNGFLNIPAERIPIGKMIYYFMSVSVFFTIISVPFSASLNAHENMLWIAIVNIIDSLFKLLVALSITHFLMTDRLQIYGFLMSCLSFVNFLLYAIYCLKRYKECSLLNYRIIDKVLLKELSLFAGWNLVGALSGLLRHQGFAIVLNLFIGTIANTAYGIANQLSAALNTFSVTMLRAINPQIMKSEGGNNRKRMLRLSMIATKFGFFLLSCLAIPCLFELPALLKLWLKTVPELTLLFCSFTLISIMVDQLTSGLTSAIQASGKIKSYMITVGSIKLLILPSAYILFRLGCQVMWVLVVYVIFEAIAMVFRIYSLNKFAGMSINEYINRVFKKELLPVLISVGTCILIVHIFSFPFRFLVTIPISIFVYATSIYFTGLCSDEKAIFNKILTPILYRIGIYAK